MLRWLWLALLCSCGGAPTAAPAPSTIPPPAPAAHPPVLVRHGSITAGDHHVCAVDAAGEVECWGKGGSGRLGVPDDADRLTPVVVPGLAGVAGVAAGADITCAWTVHGAVWCWGGDERSNRPGDHRPRAVPGLDDIVQVVAGRDGACGLRHDGRVACWTADQWRDPLWPPPFELPGVAGVVEIAGDDRHLCARTAGSEIVCSMIRDNRKHELRDQTMAPIAELHGATSLAGADEQFAVLLPGNRLASWNIADLEGRRGPAPDPPIAWIPGVQGERVVAGGDWIRGRQVCVLGGRAACWSAGDLAGDPVRAPAPTRALDPAAQDLALGEDVSCARVADRVACWGLIGRRGDGATELPAAPVEVKGIADARQLEVGYETACALRASGRVACWGARDIAHLPDGKPVIDFEPAELPGVDDAIEIAMSSDTMCARRSSGGTTCWDTSRTGERTPRGSPEMAAATRLLSSDDEVCGVDAQGHVGCRRAAIPAMEVGAAGVRALETNLAAGRPCGSRQNGDIECWHGAGAIETSFTQNYAVECAVAAARIACHHGSDRSRTFDPMPNAGRVVSYDGTYALTADGRVAMAGDPYPGRAPIEQFTDIAELRAGAKQLCGRRRDGKVVCWGPRDYLGAGQRGTPSDPTPVTGLVMGAPPPYAPAAAEPRTIATPPAGAAAPLAGTPMRGPFADPDGACSVQTCPGNQTLDCAVERLDAPRAMEAPPPFTEARLMAIDCRDPASRRDGRLTYRMLVRRGDGYWISAPLFGVGGNDHYCSAEAETRWEARDVVAGGAPEIVLSVLARTGCRSASGGFDEDLALLIAAADAGRPQLFGPIAVAEGSAASCGEGAPGCTATQDAIRLDATFSADGELAIGGPATWAAIQRGKGGAIERIEGGKRAKTPVGRYRFVLR